MSNDYVFKEPTPTGIRWKNEEAKQAFYASVLNENELTLYHILCEFAFPVDDVMDYALIEDDFFVSYADGTHEKLVTLIERTDPNYYRQIRLPLVTGHYLEHNRIQYTQEVVEVFDTFLGIGQFVIAKKIENAIEEKLMNSI